MHALRHVHQLIVPAGEMLDLHPVTEQRIEAQGSILGVVPEPEHIATVLPNVERAIQVALDEGLYALEATTELDVLQHFDTADEVVERYAEHFEGEQALVERIRGARPPFVAREHAVLRRFRAL